MRTEGKPKIIYDGDCAFCQTWVARWRHLTGERVSYIPTSDAQDSVQLVETDGQTYQGAEAIFRALTYTPNLKICLWMYQRIPGLAPLTNWAYRKIAKHRTKLSHLLKK